MPTKPHQPQQQRLSISCSRWEKRHSQELSRMGLAKGKSFTGSTFAMNIFHSEQTLIHQLSWLFMVIKMMILTFQEWQERNCLTGVRRNFTIPQNLFWEASEKYQTKVIQWIEKIRYFLSLIFQMQLRLLTQSDYFSGMFSLKVGKMNISINQFIFLSLGLKEWQIYPLQSPCTCTKSLMESETLTSISKW